MSPGTFIAGQKRRNVERIQETANRTIKIVRFVHRIEMTSQHKIKKVQGTVERSKSMLAIYTEILCLRVDKMTRNAASKCNNKNLPVSKSCVRENYAVPYVGVRGQGWSQGWNV